MIHVDEIIGPIGLGSTEPCLALINGEKVVLKFKNNNEGNKSLVNELICYQIASKLQITMPESGICFIDNKTKFPNNLPEHIDFDIINCCGPAFYSKYKDNSIKILSAQQIIFGENYKWLLPRLLLFDHLIFNKDRNQGNLLIEMGKGKKQIYVIDHTHVFNLECLWSGYQLNILLEHDFNSFDILDSNKYLYSKIYQCLKIDSIVLKSEILFFQKHLSNEFFDSIMNIIPIEWEENRDELKCLSNYLKYRFKYLNLYHDMILATKY